MQKISGGYGHGFTKIDLANAYNQIKLGPESRRKLALSMHHGVLLRNILPFGIFSAPGCFQKIVDDLTSDLSGVTVYSNNLLVSGVDAKDQIKNLERLLERLQSKGHRCSKEKCQFTQLKVEYLGHILSKKLISVAARWMVSVICQFLLTFLHYDRFRDLHSFTPRFWSYFFCIDFSIPSSW